MIVFDNLCAKKAQVFYLIAANHDLFKMPLKNFQNHHFSLVMTLAHILR